MESYKSYFQDWVIKDSDFYLVCPVLFCSDGSSVSMMCTALWRYHMARARGALLPKSTKQLKPSVGQQHVSAWKWVLLQSNLERTAALVNTLTAVL